MLYKHHKTAGTAHTQNSSYIKPTQRLGPNNTHQQQQSGVNHITSTPSKQTLLSLLPLHQQQIRSKRQQVL
jgi:hypothetical protein